MAVRLKLPALSEAKIKAKKRASRFNVLSMGEGAGKTLLAADLVVSSPLGVLGVGPAVAVITKNAEGAAEIRDLVRKFAAPAIRRQLNATRIEFVSGHTLDVYSADRLPRRYPQYSLIVVDDAASIGGLYDLYHDVILEMAREHEGQVWLLSNQRGKNSDFYRIYLEGLDSDDYSCWCFPSSTNHKWIAPDNVADWEAAQRFGGQFSDHFIELSESQKVIGDDETFRQWCERLGREGLKVDGRPFTLDDRPAMAWIYDQIPSTQDEAYRLVLVLMKCAQVGFTVMEMLATIYLGLRFGPATVGMFLPDMNLASLKSAERFMPIVRTVPDVHQLMTMDANDGKGKKAGEGNVRTRRIGDSMFVFSWTSGRATTESIPMDILSFDEVQEMTKEQIEKTQERLSASSVRFTLMGSTANFPDSDIHHWFKRGSQHRFHTHCPECGESKPMDDYFPDCIKFDSDRDIYRYVCPNGHWLPDTQAGEWKPDNPDADKPIDLSLPLRDRPLRVRSIHFPQFLSPTVSAGEMIFAFNTATDMKNFYNRKLGKPYLDPSQVPVNLEHLARCVAVGAEQGVRWLPRGHGCYMGIDQMGNFNVVVIKQRLPDNRQAVVHVEEVYSADPFARCGELMELYGVAVCVVEINPNYNDAKKFANKYPGRVFICNSFGSMSDGMIAWGDAPRLGNSDRKTDDEARDRYTLRMDQFKCMQVSMSRFTSEPPLCLFPDPQELVQEVVEKGVKQVMPVLPRAFHHFTKTALISEKDDETNQYRRSVKKVGIDPHFSYANMLCDVAWARSHGTSTFMIVGEDEDKTENAGSSFGAVGQMLNEIITTKPVQEDTCGACTAYQSGRCTENNILVGERDPGCWGFMAREY